MQRTTAFALAVMVLLASFALCFLESTAEASPSIIQVPSDYITIQSAINAANPGDTIMVASGVYYEHVVVNKTVSLVGEKKETTVIDGNRTGIVVRITASNVNLDGFTIKRSGQSPRTDSGVFLSFGSTNSKVRNNIVIENYHGIFLDSSIGITISSNEVSSNTGRAINLEFSSSSILTANIIRENRQDNGIELFDSTNNMIVGNTLEANGWAGIYLKASRGNTIVLNNLSNNSVAGLWFDASSSNLIYRNNLIFNGLNEQGQLYSSNSTNTWGNGTEGNYWNDYVGQDLNGDGIGDTNTSHLGVDSHPLMEYWTAMREFSVAGHTISIHSNSTLASFNLNQTLAQIRFNATGASGVLGFSNVTIPRALLNASFPRTWTVTVDGTYLSFTSTENLTHTSLFFTYAQSTRRVRIAVLELLNIPPVADFTHAPSDLTPFDFVNFTDTSSDSDGNIASWYWEFGDQASSVEQNPRHKYNVAGTYVVTLEVTDDRGTETVTYKTVPVRKVKTALEANAPSFTEQNNPFLIIVDLRDEKGNAVQEVTIDVDLLKERWVRIGSARTNASGVAAFTYTPSLPTGVYVVRVLFNGTQIFDESSNVFQFEVLEALDVERPKADAGADLTAYVGDVVAFNGSRSRDNVGVTSYSWDFGDAATGSGVITNHMYASSGRYTVTLTVRDAVGNTDSDSLIVSVLPREVVPGWAVGLAMVIIVGVLAYVFFRRRRK